MSGSLLAVPFRHPHGGLAAAYLRRVRRCFWTQSGQRACPLVALLFLRSWGAFLNMVRSRLANLRGKLVADNRFEAVMAAVRLGVLDLS